MTTPNKPLKLIRAAWGCYQGAGGKMCINKFLSATKKEGFSGVEMPLSVALSYGKQEMISKLQQHELGIVFQIFTDGPMAPGDPFWNNKFPTHPEPDFTPSQCALVMKKQVEDALDFNPIKINSHSMRDFFTFQQAYAFFNEVIPFQNQITNIPIMHETHRKRFFHSPWVCRDFVIGNYGQDLNFYDGDGLKMVSDLSHFTTVAETDPSDPHLNDVVDKLASKMWHVHGRVGYDHGPQVNDPRAPEWKAYLEGFERWWDNIVELQMNNESIKDITFTPEHGPPNYQQTLPYTQQPIADIWDVNSFIGSRMKARFEQKYGSQHVAK
eukprot:72216_1